MNSVADFLQVIRGTSNNGGGLYVARAATSDPSPVTFVIQGSDQAIDASLFVIPVNVYPICVGDEFYTMPISGSDKQRWGIISKINGANVIGTMASATSCVVSGYGRMLTASDLIVPPFVSIDEEFNAADDHKEATRALQAGDHVVLVPFRTGNRVMYAVTNYYN